MNIREAYILGVLCGDGWLTHYNKYYYEMGFQTKNKRFIFHIKKILERVSGKKHKVYVIVEKTNKFSPNCRSFRIKFCSKKLYKKFENYLKNLNRIKFNKKEVKCSFLKGVYDSEGSFRLSYRTPARRYYRIRLTNKNKNLLKFCKKLLESIEIAVAGIYKNNNNTYVLGIYKKSSILSFMKNIGFSKSNITRMVI